MRPAAVKCSIGVLTGIGLSGGVVGEGVFSLDGNPNTRETVPVHLRSVQRILFMVGGGHERMSVDSIVIPEPITMFTVILGFMTPAVRR
jgi:hypothetical protein